MNKLSSIGAVTFAALVGGLAVLGVFSPAQAYPEATIDVTVSSQTVDSGASFSATARSEGVVCAWTLAFDATVRTGSSSTARPFVTTFTAPVVEHDKKVPLRATCRYDDGGRTQTWHRTIVITVVAPRTAVSPPRTQAGGGPKAQAAALAPRGSDLPNAGGPNALILAGGLALLLSGATAVAVARRRAEEAEIRASRP